MENDPSKPMLSGAPEMKGGVWILDQLLFDRPGYERQAAQRVLSEVIRSWPGDVHRLWWKWFIEASTSLDLRCKSLDCSVEDAITLARDNAKLIFYTDHREPEWTAVMRTVGNRFEVLSAGRKQHSKRMRLGALRRLFEQAATGGVVRCVVVHPHSRVEMKEHSQDHPSPFKRLLQLLRPEWPDIWIVLVFAFVVGLLMLATPIAVEMLVNTVAFGRFLQPIVILAIMLLTFLGFRAAVQALQTYVVEIIQRRLFARVAADLAHRLPRTEAEQTDKEYVPELVNRFFDVVTVQKVSAQLLLDGISIVLTTVIGMAVLGFYHPFLLGFDVVLLASIAFIVFVLGRGAVGSAIKESKNKYYMAAWLEDIARCPSAFRNDGGSDFAMDRADRFIHEYLSARKKHFRILMRQILFALGLQAFASTALLGLGGWLVVSGELTLGQLVAAELIVSAIVGAFAKLGKHIEGFYDVMASIDKLGVLLDLKTERPDGILGMQQSDALTQAAIAFELHGVRYSWPGGSAPFDSLSAEIPAGSSLAVLGASGTGKSTLLDMLFGMREPTGGHISLDGFEPREIRPSVLRRRVALARGSEAFHATIEENVHMHRTEISAADVRHALENVRSLDAVSELSKGSDEVLASGGAPLTGNQCRLLTLARAIAGLPALLMVDGTLDALPDDELEPVLDYLLQEEQPWTLVIATGRKQIADRCDHAIVLQKRSSRVKS